MSNWIPRIAGGNSQKKERAADIPAGVKDWEIGKGGYRYDGDDNRYWLKWEQLLEVERANATTPDDTEYFAWFKKFAARENLRRDSFVNSFRGHSASTGSSGSKSWSSGKGGSWEGEWDGWYDSTPKEKKGWSQWWAKDVYKGWGADNSATGRLAVVLQAVRTVIRVIDDTVPPMSVIWAQNEMSYTDFRGHTIAVNPKPVVQNTISETEQIDVTTGFALHEASHSQHSREPYDTLTTPTELSPMQIAGLLLNIVEDDRIERKTGEIFPGFTGYFDAAKDWLWNSSKANLPPKWGPSLKEKIPAVIAICRWPTEAATAMTDPSFEPEIKWWSAWRDDYLDGRVDPRTTVERGLEHLREDPNTAKEMDALAAEEEALKKAMGDLKKFIDEAIKNGMMKFGKGMVCSARGDLEPLTEEVARQVQQLVEEEFTTDKPTIRAPGDHAGGPPIEITHPLEDARSKGMFIGKPNPILQRLRAALVFRQELPRLHERLLTEGRLDDDELWRFAAKDYRLFHEEIVIGRPKVQLTMLVDMSGSMMSGSKLHTAQELAQLLVFATKDMEGVHPRVFGHTGDNGKRVSNIFRLWAEGEPMSRLGLVSSLYHGNNYDGYAIEWCVKEILKRGEPEEQRVVIVLSDGYPAGSGYGGNEAERHMRLVGDWAAKQDVQVIQIAIDQAVRPERQAAMFRRWVQFEGMDKLPRQLTKLLEKIV